MKYESDTLKQALAAEYALGTLRGPARRRFERLLSGRADLRDEVRYWERRLAGLRHGFDPVAPRDVVWASIARQIEAPKVTPIAAATAPARSPTGLRFWQAWSGLATAASVVLAFALFRQASLPPPAPQIVRVEVPVPQPLPYVALLHPSNVDAQWLVTVSPERKLIRVSGSGDYPLNRKTESLELWVIGDDGKPRSLGILPIGDAVDLPMPRGMRMPKKPTLAVSREPAGGSPTGQPTGPVILATPAQRAS